MQHIEDNTEQNNTEQDNTENNAQPQRTEHSTDNLYTYSFDFYHHTYISKNSIIQLYTNLIHFARLIDEVSK